MSHGRGCHEKVGWGLFIYEMTGLGDRANGLWVTARGGSIVRPHAKCVSCGPDETREADASRELNETRGTNASRGDNETLWNYASRDCYETRGLYASRDENETRDQNASRGWYETRRRNASRAPYETRKPVLPRGACGRAEKKRRGGDEWRAKFML